MHVLQTGKQHVVFGTRRFIDDPPKTVVRDMHSGRQVTAVEGRDLPRSSRGYVIWVAERDASIWYEFKC